MGNAKVSTDFSSSKYTDAQVANKANSIADKTEGNPNFTEPQPTPLELRTANNLYIASLARVESGSREDTVIKNQHKATVIALLKSLGAYVQAASKGDEAIILSSGFDTHKKPGYVGELSKPENMIVKPGNNKGTMAVSCDVVEHANFYEFAYMEITGGGTENWIQKTSTKRKIELDGLTSGKQYAFRAAAAGSHPTRVWSDVVYSYVL